MAGPLDIRKDLRKAVRSIVNRDDFYEQIQLPLEKIANSSGYASCLENCARESGKSYQECARECAKQANISEQFKGIWGKK